MIINIALVLKKIARKGSLAKQKLRSRKGRPQDDTSVSSCSTNEKADPVFPGPKQTLQQVDREIPNKQCLANGDSAAVEAVVSSPPKEESARTMTVLEEENSHSQKPCLDITERIESNQENERANEGSGYGELSPEIIIRDFAYPITSPQHFGQSPTLSSSSAISLSCSEFNGQQARVLYDFEPETEYELALKAGDVIWVQYRQCPGWLIADICNETGLIPESYVELI
ncbi:HOG (high osmolarity glycerol) pathway protein [Apophysomyces ossiformis]|uniref:HOG (High osmolarity glycerol) pathway protein n=1 Tax=Apophysomyces ossiformis TaxID=679940 RepID=A0A8H7BX92_9FUNG|nr:HOG (high osmolarity glycerol) pathway protein [Apophysomyces ossiformis]